MASPHPVQEEGDLQVNLERRSPSTMEKQPYRIQKVTTGEATIDVDDVGCPRVSYKAKPCISVDKSQADLLAMPKTEEQVQEAVEACLQLIEWIKKKEEIKEERAPSGVVLDRTKIPTTEGKYMEGKEFEVLKQVLGKGNSAGNIVVIKDKQSKSKHALKTMMISEFRKEEVRAWVDLSDSGIAPSLYMFRLKENRVEMRMEILENVVTLQSVLDDMIGSVYDEDPALLRPFSLFVFHGLLKAAQAMHEKNWSHRDLHGGNVLLQEGDSGKMEVKVIDFGRASPIRDASGTLTASGVESDFLEIIRNFTALYPGEAFEDRYELKREKDREEKLRQVTAHWEEKDRRELFDLIAMTLAVVDRNSKHFLRPEHVIRELENKMDEEYARSLKRVAAILFPSKVLPPAQEEMDEDVPDSAFADDEESEVDLFVKDYLESLSIQPKWM